MSHGWTYSYWAMAEDGEKSCLKGCQVGWTKAGVTAEIWLSKVARRIEFFP